MIIYDADCHTLKKDQKTDVKIDNYFLLKERSLFEIKVDFLGENKTTHHCVSFHILKCFLAQVLMQLTIGYGSIMSP
jgi:hypothetical protein